MQRALGKKLAILLIVGIVFYALAGFLLAPRVIERALKGMVQQEPGLALEIASTSVNPFTLVLSATNVKLFGAENKAIVALDRLDIDLQVSSLLEQAWVVRSLLIDHALVSLEAGDDNSNATLRLCDAFWRSISGNSDRGANRIEYLAIRRSELQVHAATRGESKPNAAVSVAGLELEMRHLGTTSPAPFELTASAEGFAPGLSWSVAKLRSNAAIGQTQVQAPIDNDLTLQTLEIVDPRLRLQWDAADQRTSPRRLIDLLQELPEAPLKIGKIDVVGGHVDFVDQGVSPEVHLTADEIAGSIVPDGLDSRSTLSLRGRLADAGHGEIIAEWLPSQARSATRVDVRLQDFPLPPVSPYLAETLGRRVSGGSLDLALDVFFDDKRLSVNNRIDVRKLQLGERVLAPGAVDLPLELAVALLENNDGLIAFQVPLEPRAVTTGFDPAALFARAFTDYVTELTSKPMEILGKLTGEPDMDFGTVEFLAGSAEITDETATKLAALDSALEQRPKLGLIAYPGFDPLIDREALARQQIRLHVILATSSHPPGQAAGIAIDFADSKVHSVLEEFAANRLTAARQAAISRRFSNRNATYYRAVFDALVANEEVSAASLNRLAGYRARSVIGALVAAGNEDGRLSQADTVEATRTGGDRAFVRLEVQANPLAMP